MTVHDQPAQFTARWKALSDVALRAVCGKPGCPGALGRFQRFTADRLDPTYDEEILQSLESIHPGLPRGTEKLKRPIDEQRAMATLERHHAYLIRDIKAKKRAAESWQDKADRFIDEWQMTPDDALDPTTDPIYYGYPDSGFRISYRGKRTRKGLRISRRPFPAVSEFDKHLRDHGLASERSASGQSPSPPCKIWCPVCDSLNFVPRPEKFEIVETTSH